MLLLQAAAGRRGGRELGIFYCRAHHSQSTERELGAQF